MSELDLSEQVLYGKDLRGQNLYGAKVSLKCDTFDGVLIDNQQLALLLLLIQLAEIDHQYQQRLRDLARDIVGEEHYRVLLRYMLVA